LRVRDRCGGGRCSLSWLARWNGAGRSGGRRRIRLRLSSSWSGVQGGAKRENDEKSSEERRKSHEQQNLAVCSRRRPQRNMQRRPIACRGASISPPEADIDQSPFRLAVILL
jgi:hypothetical protein